MPTILVRADHDGDSAPETLIEHVISANISDGYYADQLIERLIWATRDAEDMEQTAHRTDVRTSTGAWRAVDRSLRSLTTRDTRVHVDSDIIREKSSDPVKVG
jgi:hypothetical protein